MPPFVGLSPKMGHMEWADTGTLASSASGMPRSSPTVRAKTTWSSMASPWTAWRIARRSCSSFDGFRRDVDSSGLMDGLDSFNEQAFRDPDLQQASGSA